MDAIPRAGTLTSRCPNSSCTQYLLKVNTHGPPTIAQARSADWASPSFVFCCDAMTRVAVKVKLLGSGVWAIPNVGSTAAHDRRTT